MKTIEIILDPVGSPKIDEKGFTGNQCTEETKAYEESFNNTGEGLERRIKPEFNQIEIHGDSDQDESGGMVNASM